MLWLSWKAFFIMSQNVFPFYFSCPCPPSTPTQWPSLFWTAPDLLPKQSGHSLLWAPPTGLERPYTQPVLRQEVPTTGTSPPLHVPLSGQSGSGDWLKKRGTTQRPHPYLPPPVLTANLHHVFLPVLYQKLSASLDLSPASRLLYIWSLPTSQQWFSPHPTQAWLLSKSWVLSPWLLSQVASSIQLTLICGSLTIY